MNKVVSQFSHPQGWLGHIAGWAMAVKNRPRLDWAISSIEVQPTHYILEIGFGPGVAIEQFASKAVNGLVAGVDHSHVMVQQACDRNAKAIEQGRVELKQGSANDPLPYADEMFDRVFMSNSHFFWTDPIFSFGEIRRVLKPGGEIIVCWQPRWAKTETQVNESANQTVEHLKQAGFESPQLTFKPLKPVTGICAIAPKPI